LILPSDPVREVLYAIGLFIYIVFLIWFTRKLFKFMVGRGMRENVAVYYNRKIIHMGAGGVVALLTPFIFSSPLIPTLFALAIALILYLPHRSRKLLGWFQTSENAFEVNFAIAWGLSLFFVWILTSNPFYAVIPPLFISFGDAVTGIIRNGLYGRRTKSWYGNLGMLFTTIPIGFILAGYPGVVAAIVSSIVEHYEFPPYIDDNVLITLASSLILISSKILLGV